MNSGTHWGPLAWPDIMMLCLDSLLKRDLNDLPEEVCSEKFVLFFPSQVSQSNIILIFISYVCTLNKPLRVIWVVAKLRVVLRGDKLV